MKTRRWLVTAAATTAVAAVATSAAATTVLGNGFFLDNMVVAQVPESMSLLLFGTFLAVAGRQLRRRPRAPQRVLSAISSVTWTGPGTSSLTPGRQRQRHRRAEAIAS